MRTIMNRNDPAEGFWQAISTLMSQESEDTDDEEQHFDISLPATHSYMGPAREAVAADGARGPGWRGRVPAVAHHGVVFPGETVPMLVTRDVEAMSRVIHQDKVFGLLSPDEDGLTLSGYGVLCEVFEVLAGARGAAEGEGEAGARTPPLASFKARATHRFRCCSVARHELPLMHFDRMRLVEVVVLTDVLVRRPLHPERRASAEPPRPDSPRERQLRRADAALTPWPLFVYDECDLRRMRRGIEDYFQALELENLPDEPVALSFWTASNLELSPHDRLELFLVDDALLRLHMELRFIAKKSVLECAACSVEIAQRDHIFAMSTEGVHANYVNLGGYVHDLVTVSRVRNTHASGAPSAEYSWFPGYAWTVTVCAACRAHVGWRFDAQRRGLRPPHFYGLCRNYVVARVPAAPRPPAPPEPEPAPTLLEQLRAPLHVFPPRRAPAPLPESHDE